MGKLTAYQKNSRRGKTPEPFKKKKDGGKEPIFVVQKHHARTLHYDFRLEISGLLKSWAVPKGPPKRIGDKHLAVLTKNHPLSYAHYEGVIPEGEYGAGEVEIWDQGTLENIKPESLSTCFRKGVLEFRCQGTKMKGTYALVHMKEKSWLLLKVRTKK